MERKVMWARYNWSNALKDVKKFVRKSTKC